MKYLWVILKPLFVSVGIVISGYMAVDAWIVQRAETVINPVKKEFLAWRSADMQHLDNNFTRMDKRLDRIEALIRDTKR